MVLSSQLGLNHDTELGTSQRDVISLVMGLSYLGPALWQSRALPRFPEDLNLDISGPEGRACTFFVLLHPNNMAGSTYLVIKKKLANLWVLYGGKGKGISTSILLLFPRNAGFLPPLLGRTQETSYNEATNDESTICLA